MESTVRTPQTGDMVLVLVKMNSGKITEISGPIADILTSEVYFAVDAIELIHGPADDDGRPLERKIWPEDRMLLKIGVPLEKMKPFDGKTIDEDAPCWEVRI